MNALMQLKNDNFGLDLMSLPLWIKNLVWMVVENFGLVNLEI